MTKKDNKTEKKELRVTKKVQIPDDEKSSTSGKEFMERGDYILEKKRQEMVSKIVIAKHIAKNFVNNFDAVLLDAGSTAELIAEELFTQRKYLTVMTNNMGAYVSYTRAIAPKKQEEGRYLLNELLLTGGRYDATYEALFGDATIRAIELFSPNVTIIGVSGFRFNEGVFCHGSEEVRVKKLLWAIPTDIRVVAADWTKIGKRDAYAFGPQIEELAINADRAVVVTTYPHYVKIEEQQEFEEQQKFDEQIKKIEDANIEVVKLDISEHVKHEV
jgi:DeoR/GlpR family transcriptional regulator of sugar metabolism